MKIGYVMQEGVDIVGPVSNGPASHVKEVIGGLTKRGHEVRVVVRLNGLIWVSDDLQRFRPATAHWMDRGPLRWIERGVRRVQFELRLPYAALFESLRFRQVCIQELANFDLLYERLSWVAYGGGLAASSLNVPLILEDNGDALFDLEAKGMAPSGLQRSLSLRLMGRAVRRAAHVVSSGAGWREQFIRRWDYDPDRVTTIENGTALVELVSRDELRSFNGPAVPGSAVQLVYLGGFYPWHGVPILLEALKTARSQGAHAKLVMVGDGDGFQEAHGIVERLGLSGSVTLMGHLRLEDYAPVLAQSDIGVSPYCNWPEFSGLKVLDYKAAGLPTIASGTNGHPPTLMAGRTGLIVPPGEVDPLTDAIVRLCRDEGLRKKMGQAARLEAETSHSWLETVKKLEGVFGTTLDREGAH